MKIRSILAIGVCLITLTILPCMRLNAGEELIGGQNYEIEVEQSSIISTNEIIPQIEKPEIVIENIEEPIEIQEEKEEEILYSAEDLRWMAAIIYAEAGNQCVAGQQAVGIVVMNRVADVEFEDTVHDVIYEPIQFSPVANGSYDKALALYDAGSLPEVTLDAAKYALSGNSAVEYNGTTYDLSGYLYFSRYVRGCRLQIQDHMFK